MHRKIIKNKNTLCLLLYLLFLSNALSAQQIANGYFNNLKLKVEEAPCDEDDRAITDGKVEPWHAFGYGVAGVATPSDQCIYDAPIEGLASAVIAPESADEPSGIYQNYSTISGNKYRITFRYKVFSQYVSRLDVVLSNDMYYSNDPSVSQVVYSVIGLQPGSNITTVDVDFIPTQNYSQLGFKVIGQDYSSRIMIDEVILDNISSSGTCCPVSQLVQNQLVTAGARASQDISATSYIKAGNSVGRPNTTAGDVVVKPGNVNSTITFRAGSYVSLEPGFSVVGSNTLTLKALPESCDGDDNRLMDVKLERFDAENYYRASVIGGSGQYSYRWIFSTIDYTDDVNELEVNDPVKLIVTDLQCNKSITRYSENFRTAANTEESIFETSAIKVYPNPTHGELLNILSAEALDVEIYNSLGKLMLKQQCSQSNRSISVEALPSDAYFVKLFRGDNLVKVEKVLHVK